MRWNGLLTAAALCCLVLLAGCTQPGREVNISPVVTPAIAVPDLSPEPTDAVPPDYRIAIAVSRGTLSFNPVIKVEFRGGQGMQTLSSLEGFVIRSDGTTLTAALARPSIGEFMEITGTTGKDRIIVYARMMNGERYRIYDQVLEFRD